ncbi:hypothetical protein PL9214650678 [Planktothrix tepida PCC 9214]|uniref:Uncharacterized protein n=1 Tax=Planktothrix tepida PCC 9214 TaxID=671072 RepID=A0A1J1LS61_9CYAN|nr:hypothetical protein PL9214650678 [Planktothrix tepida PCC 9214]
MINSSFQCSALECQFEALPLILIITGDLILIITGDLILIITGDLILIITGGRASFFHF